MIESSLAQNGYENSRQSTGDGRGVEYQLLARVTRELSEADKDAPDFLVRQAQALHNNLKLWTKLAIDVAHEGNGLPQELRSNLFYLAEFTRHHTSKVFNREADANILVEINTSVMRGLRAQTTQNAHIDGAVA